MALLPRPADEVGRDRARDAVLASWEEDLKDAELEQWFTELYAHQYGIEIGKHSHQVMALLRAGRQQIPFRRQDQPTPNCPSYLRALIEHSCTLEDGQPARWALGGSPDPTGVARDKRPDPPLPRWQQFGPADLKALTAAAAAVLTAPVPTTGGG